MDHTSTSTAFASSSSAAPLDAGSDIHTIINLLADDLEEFSQTENCEPDSDEWRKLCMVKNVFRAMLTASQDPTTTRESFFLHLLNAAYIQGLKIPEESQPQTFIYMFSGEESIDPPPKSMPKVSAEWEKSNGRASSKSSSNRYRPYDFESRGVRPPIPEPPRMPYPRQLKGLGVVYPDEEIYWMNYLVGCDLKAGIDDIKAQAAAAHIPVPEIPPPRWNGRKKQFFVKVPWQPFGFWYDYDDEEGRKYRLAVGNYEVILRRYWDQYPPREGEFEEQAGPETESGEQAPAPEGSVKGGDVPEAVSEPTPILGKRSRELELAGNNDNEGRSGPSIPRSTKKLRRNLSRTIVVPPATSSDSAPVPASPSATPARAATTTRGVRTTRTAIQAAATSQEPTRRSARVKARKNT